MLQENDLQFFRENGYLIVRDVIPKENLLRARTHLEKLFSDGTHERAPHSSPFIINDLYEFAPELLPLIFTQKYMDAVRGLLGEQAAWIPECAAHRARFFGWHKDSSGVERAGMESHKGYQHPILTAAVYFQDNGPGAGGLTVVAGTQREPDRTKYYYSKRLGNRLKNKVLKLLGRSELDRLEKHPKKLDLPSRLGDLVLFDIRLSHRATFPKEEAPQEKLAIFNAFVRNDEVGREFVAFQKKRPEPHYQYFSQTPPSECVYQWADAVGMPVLY